MAALGELTLDAQHVGRDGFVVKYADPMLLVQRLDLGMSASWSFRTCTMTSANLKLVQSMADEGITVSDELMSYEVLVVHKTQNNAWRDRVSVGRASNNDIVLCGNSISKLHAHFLTAHGQLLLQDVGSRNGTTLRGAPIPRGQAVQVLPGDKIAFGGVEVVLLDAAALYDFIAKHVQRTEKR